MQPHNLHLYFFSPTGGTKTVAGLFAEQLGAPDACTDITVHAEAKTFTADDRLLLFFPVYGGRVPEPCLARVRALHGTDTPVTLVAVFGNRAVDDALLEMRDTLAPLGFRVVAAAEVIAPHSINTDIAIGRPDASDRARIAAFCAQLASKLAEDAPAGITVPGNKPYCDYNGLPLKPTGGLRCIGCGLCADNCPAGAIPKDAPKKVDKRKCISCMRCIQICENVQTVKIWDLLGTGSRATVDASRNRRIQDTECTYCGQCITHCPTAALRERDDTGIVFDAIDDPNTVTVVQVAPAVRAAWAEQFNLSPEFATPKRMAAALRELGFNYVFDTDFAADLTIMEEGSEFLERFTHKKDYRWPMFTSCCPGWVRFLKSQYPERTEELSTAKSPQQMFGAIAKTYFAEKIGIDPKRLFVVSIMPCIAKKSECTLPTMRGEDGIPDVDVSITTRELDIMLRANHISPVHLPEEEFDSPLGSGTGAAVVFGATGGVMDAALRSAYYLVTGENPDPDAFTAVRGMDGWKEASFNIPTAGEVKVAVVSGLGNARKLLYALERGEVSYDFVEVMACPGGCAGGGGQPIQPATVRSFTDLKALRAKALYDQDANMPLRKSHENPVVKELYAEYLGEPGSHLAHHILHTTYVKRGLYK